MRLHPRTVPATVALALAIALAAVVAAHDGPHETAAAVAATAPQLGKPETTKWTATTFEAVTSEAHKKVLDSGKVATVTGEVVDVSCYLQLGKRGEAHIPCGTKCIMNGMPIGLVDEDDDLYILFAEEHHPRRDGTVDLKKVFVPLLAKQVTVTGMMTEMKGYKALFVQAAEIGGAAEPGAEPAKAAEPAKGAEPKQGGGKTGK